VAKGSSQLGGLHASEDQFQFTLQLQLNELGLSLFMVIVYPSEGSSCKSGKVKLDLITDTAQDHLVRVPNLHLPNVHYVL
jgi:hypothetical protein